MKEMSALDPTDKQILSILQFDARLEIKQIAGMVHKSTSPVHERIRKLHSMGVIKRYIAVLDREKIGRPTLVIAQVMLSEHTSEALSGFEQQANKIPEVMLCLHLSGDCDFMLHIAVAHPDAYHELLMNEICTNPLVAKVNSCFVLKECKIYTPFPL